MPFEEYDKQCTDGQICVPVFTEPCNGPTCISSGQCFTKSNAKLHIQEHASSHCQPRHAVLDNNCAKLSLVFEEGLSSMVRMLWLSLKFLKYE